MPGVRADGAAAGRAVLYVRVSGEDQKKRGYSLPDQREALRAWCSENGYEVLAEVEDAGHSGAYLERPGLDRVREMVAAGGVDIVVVLFRDRLARGVYAQLLAEEFREGGARFVALNRQSDDTPDGELGDNVLDVISAWERKKIAERMNRGKRRKAREGKIVAGPAPDYGFDFDGRREGYVVNGTRMAVVERIFRMVGAEGAPINAVRRALEREGIPAPKGGRGWSRQYLNDCVNDDVYLARPFEEVARLVPLEVAASLDPSRSYGVWWYGKERHATTRRRVVGPDGTVSYRKSKKSVPAPKEDWIAVPVPDPGVPREWVLSAREAIRGKEWASNAGDRFWELTGGVIRCAECGRTMSVNFIRAKGRGYYRCNGRYNGGVAHRCSMGRTVRAREAEERVWGFVRGLLTGPERLARGLDRMLERERRPTSRDDEAACLRRASELDAKLERLLDMRLAGDVPLDLYRAKSAELGVAREAARRDLEAACGRLACLEAAERDRDALVAHYASLVPQGLDGLPPEGRNRVYRTLRLRVLAYRDGSLAAEWGYNALTTPPGSGRTPGR